MPLTTGLVQHLTWTGSMLCAWIGTSATSAELLFLVFKPTDSDADLGFKRNVAKLLARAALTGYPVSAGHPENSALIDSIRVGGFDISPVGYAVHDDLYSVTGAGIPADVQVVFDSATATVTITPDLVRSHWVLVASLPAAIPVGRNRVRLQGTGMASDWVPVEVSSSPPVPARVLYSGQPKDRPYNIVLVANPAILTEAGALIADPVLTNRAAYRDVVGYILRNLLTVTEDLLRQGDWDREFRVFSVFDTTPGATDANALAHELNPNLMETRRDKLRPFLSPYNETADMVFVIYSSTTHTVPQPGLRPTTRHVPGRHTPTTGRLAPMATFRRSPAAPPYRSAWIRPA